MSRLFCSIAVIGLVFSTAFAKKNPYMTTGTEEFKNVTEKVMGVWNIGSYTRDERGEQINSIYKKATVEFARMDKEGRRGKVIWKFHLSDSVIDFRASEDKAKDPELKIDNYIVKIEGLWDIYQKDSKLIRLTSGDPEFEISGSGTEFGGFVKGQNAMLKGSDALGGIGGVAGFVASKSMKAGTGLNDIVAELPYHLEYTLQENAADFKGNSNLIFKGTK